MSQGLHGLGYEIVSTGGSAKAIESSGVPVRKVEDLTGFPEMLDGELRHRGLEQLHVLQACVVVKIMVNCYTSLAVTCR